jgi:hypothetical protein
MKLHLDKPHRWQAIGHGFLLAVVAWFLSSLFVGERLWPGAVASMVVAFVSGVVFSKLLRSATVGLVFLASLPWFAMNVAMPALLIHAHAGGNLGAWGEFLQSPVYWLRLFAVPIGLAAAAITLRARARGNQASVAK